MKGRKPKPTTQALNEGDPRKLGKHKLEQKLAAEPKAARGLPKCPEHLQGRARTAWKFWATELEAMGLDRRPDAMMLEGACVGYSRAVQADLIIADEGPVCEHFTVDAQTFREVRVLKAHPAVAISKAAWTQVHRFCSEFGLSPVSRTRLAVERKDDAEDELMAVLMQPREPRQSVQ